MKQRVTVILRDGGEATFDGVENVDETPAGSLLIQTDTPEVHLLAAGTWVHSITSAQEA